LLTFFHSPGSCSDGILFLLKETGAEFRTQIVNIRAGEQRTETYLAQNPKGKVPALLCDDGQLLTEFQAIAFWLAQHYPDAGLWPKDTLGQTRVLETLDYLVGTVHMRGFTFVIMPQKFISDEDGQADIRHYGRSEVEKSLAYLSQLMGNRDYLLGEFSLADAPLIYLLRWAEAFDFKLGANLSNCLARLRERHPEQ
jgi:glutathione S-transferase